MIALDSLLYLIFGLSAGRIMHAPLLASFLVDNSPKVLKSMTVLNLAFDLLTISGFILFVFCWRNASERSERRRTIVLTMLLLVPIILTVFQHSFLRDRFQQLSNNTTHDGLIQTEVAAHMILQGRNPYTADFTGTVAEQPLLGNHSLPNIPKGQSPLTHFVYPPLIPLLVVPTIWISRIFHVNVEGQIMYLLIFLAVSGYITWQTPTWKARRLLLLLTIGNPFIWLYIIAGYNDIVAAAFAVAAAVAVHRHRLVAAGVLFGLALASKQNWFVMVPLWVVWLWRVYRQSAADERRTIHRSVIATIITLGVLYGPFLVWNAPALYDDLIRFVSASSPAYYPISGSTFWQLAVIFSHPSNPWIATAHSMIQAIIGLPVLAGLCRVLYKRPIAATWLTCTVVITLLLAVLNRFAYDNYFSAIIFVGVAAYVLEHHMGQIETQSAESIDS